MKTFVRLSLLGALAVGSFGATALLPTDAEACGGTFCDGGAPNPMPVDQSGENILFVRDGDFVEAHIQIQYMGSAEKFGWVVPLLKAPEEIAPGSEPLFQNMLAGTVPTYGFSRQNDVCTVPDDASNDGFGTGAAGGDDGGGEGGDPEGPTILSMQEVGAFEVTVLTAESAQDVVDWLMENDYQTDEEAVPILEEYLAEGHVFAAVKLTAGADVDEIHPIMFRFQSNEPCVPLRLTRIAAVEDMEVRTFFLSDTRVAPRTYRHVEVNPLLIDWPNQATNYKEVISIAVDEESADGRAFVTEYAGSSEVVPQNGISGPGWSAAAFEGLAPTSVIAKLTEQGLWQCGEDFNTFEYVCQATHPLVQPLLDEFLPVPAGVDPLDFYENPANYADQIDADAWGDGSGFAAGLLERVIAPGEHAEDLLRRFGYLTRMYTTISPAEMTEDPMFHENPNLGDVEALRMATQRILCNGDSIWTLPDGREVYVRAGDPWPDFDAALPDDGTTMPASEFIDEVPTSDGAPMRLVDNQELIDTKLRAYNEGQGWNGASVPEGGEPTPELAGGCGCTSGGGAGAVWMLGFGVLAFVGRRRRD